MNPPKESMTKKEICNYLGFSPATLYRRLKKLEGTLDVKGKRIFTGNDLLIVWQVL